VVVTAAAAKSALEQALLMAARSGRISLFGGLPKADPVIAFDPR
jgi:L-iditol 2-dehydrogenase